MSKQKYPQATKNVNAEGEAKKGKINGYHSEKLHAKWDKKRSEAKARQRHYEGLTVQARIALAKSRPGESKQELARLEKLLTAKSTVKV